MSTATQYNPNKDLNERLLALGLSKTVYALVTPETERVRCNAFGLGDDCYRIHEEYLNTFREAWTGKQDRLHEEFFDRWLDWSKPVVDLDRTNYPFFYPTAGASEPLRQFIFNQAAQGMSVGRIFFFQGEYEGYKAMAEAAGVRYTEVPRDDWRKIPDYFDENFDTFFVSQPSAIDGNVWHDFNEFVAMMPENSVVADVTYVGAVPRKALCNPRASGLPVRFDLNAPSIRSIVFSLSKPFGAYYDRIGGCFTREEDPALFGNKWFKNLSSLRYGTTLMENLGVFDLPERYGALQQEAVDVARQSINQGFRASDVYILAHDTMMRSESDICDYLARAGTIRVCLTPYMAGQIGTSGDV